MSKNATYEFVGYVDEFTRGTYGADMVVRRDVDAGSVQYPQRMLFSLSTNVTERLDSDPQKDDLIRVTFAPSVSEGISKSTGKKYRMAKNSVLSVDCLSIAIPGPTEDAKEAETEALPF